MARHGFTVVFDIGKTTLKLCFVEPDGTMGACLIPVEIVRSGHPTFSGEPPGYCIPLYDGNPWTGTDASDAD